MPTNKRNYRRGSGRERCEALIEATQECIVRGGIQKATVRCIAAEAGVTPGLIRHYFPGKNELLCAAYRDTMARMIQQTLESLEGLQGGAVQRLHVFVRTILSAPVMSSRQHQLWASFTSLMQSMPALADVQRESDLEFRRVCYRLVTAVFEERNLEHNAKQIEHNAIALNALLYGLWLEGCVASDLFEQAEVAQIGVGSVNAMLGLK